MKPQFLFVFAIAMLCIVNTCTAMPQAAEVDELLGDKQLVRREINCILRRGPCDAIGKQILRVLPEALGNSCRRCTPYQARNARRLISFMQQNYPREWNMIRTDASYRG